MGVFIDVWSFEELAEKSTILVVGRAQEKAADVIDRIGEGFNVVSAQGPLEALSKLSRAEFSGIYVVPDEITNYLQLARLLQSERILEGIPDGVALLDEQKCIIWANAILQKWGRLDDLVGRNFYEVFPSGVAESSLCPFQSALQSSRDTSAVILSGQSQYLQLHVAPLQDRNGSARCLIVTVRDITAEILQRQKLDAIHQAGSQLTDLKPSEIFEMSVEERIELLKSNILHFTRSVLNFDVVEIRLLDQATGELVPLLSEGIEEEAQKKKLRAAETDNGVTGHVAATGQSYLCADTTKDPLYIRGFEGARCSLTVPIILHDEILGTFNVESPVAGAFTESDQQFLEIFCRSVAVALNTFELLVAQQANTAQASVEAIHGEVALPVDEILNEVVNVMERYIGHDADVTERLQRVLKNARYIKQVIQKVGERLAPAEAAPEPPRSPISISLRNSRVLVVDADETVRQAAHSLLERQGCCVETAQSGLQAVMMVRVAGKEDAYDAIITDIRLPDVSGYELLVRLKELLGEVPLVLMTGFGYDPGHSIVKARQAGLEPDAVLFKPFRLDQLLETVARTVNRGVQVAPA
jgi:CheY-like chemotaxis protein/GAF domain-containing protein